MENRVRFTKEMIETHTILIPEMLNIHFEMIKNIFIEYGYKVEHLHNKGPQITQTGLKYVHNDTCYPALLVIGQMIDALQSGKYDLDKVALMITQTGGGCRASNYIYLLRKALKRAGMGHIPVISLNLAGLEDNPGFKLNLSMIRKAVAAVIYGDELMLLSNQTRPYEKVEGDTDRILTKWIDEICLSFRHGKNYQLSQIKKTMNRIAEDYSKIPVRNINKVKVGVVGEIYIKYSSLGNNDLEAFLFSQDCEYMVPGLLGFIMYSINSGVEDYRLYGGKKVRYAASGLLMGYLRKMEKLLITTVSKTRFKAPGYFSHAKTLVKDIVSLGSKMGEGWFLTAEMLELVEQGYPNIVCAQPFGCLPNHVNGRGMMNRIKEVAPEANIVAIDYDPGASRVNQENRIKLMLASAKERLGEVRVLESDEEVLADADETVMSR